MNNHENDAAQHLTPLGYFGLGAVLVIGAAIAGQIVMKHFEPLQYLEERNFDRWITSHTQPAPSTLAVIEVDDAAYFALFGGSSPLRQDKVQELIKVADQAGAKVIGVDIDTRDWDPAKLRTLHTRAPIVWAEVPLGSYRVSHKELENNAAQIEEIETCRGSASVERSPLDGVVRTMPGSGSLADMMTVLGLGSDCKTVQRERRAYPRIPQEPSYIRFVDRRFSEGHRATDSGQEAGPVRTTIPPYLAASVLQGASRKDWIQTSNSPGLFQDKYVLIGGSFEDSGDRHLTPFGETFGLDIQADILATKLCNNAIQRAPDLLVIGSDIGFGFVLLVILWRLRERPTYRWMALTVVASAGVIILTLSLFYGGLFLSFVPILLGVLFHQIADSYIEQYATRRKLQACLSRLRT